VITIVVLNEKFKCSHFSVSAITLLALIVMH